jgi:hypothetical protein
LNKFLCFAEGHDGRYEAICVDLDISIQGTSFSEVFDGLNSAVASYIEDAMKEDEATARQLLSRRAPWHVRLRHIARVTAHVIGARRQSGREEASFDVACPA